MQLLDTFCYWIEERDLIRELKEAGVLPPWSKDRIFQTVYFCNVHREDDRVTQWIRKYWNDYTHDKFEYSMCLARLVNKPSTLDILKFACPPPMVRRLMEAMTDEGNVVWGSAYVVTTHGRKMDKLAYLEEVLHALWHAPLHEEIMKKWTLKDAHEYLMQFEGFGSFMAAQVIADLKNTEGHSLTEAPDWWTFSAPGPGSMRGLQWVYGRKVSPKEYQHLMTELHPVVQDKVGFSLCQQDLQNCLCEFDKYMRVKMGTGRSKRKYNGSAC